jgi:type VI secretion system Hcp family effector
MTNKRILGLILVISSAACDGGEGTNLEGDTIEQSASPLETSGKLEFYVETRGNRQGRFPGESAVRGRENATPAIRFHSGVTRTRTDVICQPASFTKAWGKASPSFLNALTADERLEFALSFVSVDRTGRVITTETINFERAHLVSDERVVANVDGVGTAGLLEEISFTFETMTVIDSTGTTATVNCPEAPPVTGGAGGAGGAGGSGGTVSAALMVVGSSTLSVNDSAIGTRLGALGFSSVQIVVDANATAADANGKQLVLISESVVSANVGTKFNNATTAIVNLESALQDDLGMTGAVFAALGMNNGIPTGPLPPANSQHGTIPVTNLYVELGVPPVLTGGLPTGMVTAVVSSEQPVGWGYPGGNATIITRTPPVRGSTPGVPTSYVYERNATLNNGTLAAGKRGNFYAIGNVPSTQTANSWSLFDAMIAWARQ